MIVFGYSLTKTKVMKLIKFFIIALILFCLAYYFFSPRPSARYYKRIINRVGAPDGFSRNPNRDDFRDNLLENPYGRTTYTGREATDNDRAELVKKLQDLGFKNVRWGSPSGTDGIYASCKDAQIFIRLNQKQNDPVDIEVFSGGNIYASRNRSEPFCPWLWP